MWLPLELLANLFLYSGNYTEKFTDSNQTLYQNSNQTNANLLNFPDPNNYTNNHPSWKFIPTDECGKTDFAIESKILDGKKAALGQFPWMALLGISRLNVFRNEYTFVCGGTLITQYYVLSAAHCGQNIIIVRLGTNSLDEMKNCDSSACTPLPQDIEVEKLHRGAFNKKYYRNDIMLIQLRKAAQFNDFVQPACLPRGKLLNMDWTDKHFHVSGWGLLSSENKESSPDMMYDIMPLVERSHCDARFATGTLTEKQYCVVQDKGNDSCNGDPGTPMTMTMAMTRAIGEKDDKRSYVFGTASYGLQHCGSTGPIVFTRIAPYMDGILDKISK